MPDFLTENFGLSGRKALVTGAGRGIGKAIAEALAVCGAEVCVHFHTSRQAAEETVAEISRAGGKAWSVQADLTSAAEAQNMAAQIKDRWGCLDILINNAGDLVKRCPIADLTDDVIDTTLKVNLHSMVYTTRACLPLLRLGKQPCLVNVGSVAAHHGGGNGATLYAATKGAVHTFTRGLAKEVAPGIRVNGLAPGVIFTDFHRRHSTEQRLQAFADSTPLQRLGTPKDVAAAAVYLCGPGASFVTGEIIEVNGGIWLA